MRRNKFQLDMDILKACVGKPRTTTHLIYGSNINGFQIIEHTKDLQKRGLLKISEEVTALKRHGNVLSNNPKTRPKRLYQTTSLGLKLVKLYEEMMKIYSLGV